MSATHTGTPMQQYAAERRAQHQLELQRKAAGQMYDALKFVMGELRHAAAGGAISKPTIKQLNEIMVAVGEALDAAEGV